MEYTTAADVSGQALVAIVQGVPAGLRLSKELAESDLKRCLAGYQAPANAFCYVEIESGLYGRNTSGSPVSFLVYGDASGADEAEALAADSSAKKSAVPRPGRGDLPAVLKTAADSVTAVTGRLDAYDEAACVVAASLPRELLAQLGVEVFSFVSRIGAAALSPSDVSFQISNYSAIDTEFSPVRCPDKRISQEMEICLNEAREQGETLGGSFQIVVTGLLPGVGDFAQRRNRLTARLAAVLFSLTGVVAVEFGDGCGLAQSSGPACHDAVLVSPLQGFSRASNHAGGIEDGVTSGEKMLITVSVAPCAATAAGIESVNLDTLQRERSSAGAAAPVCIVPGVAVAAEAEVAFVLANAYLEQFGNANMTDICANVAAYSERLRRAAR